MKSPLSIAILALLTGVGPRCSNNPVAGGSEETNARTVAVAGRVTDSRGIGIEGALAIIRADTLSFGSPHERPRGAPPHDSIPTDSNGTFRFDSVDAAFDYRVEATSGDSLAAMYTVSASDLDSSVDLGTRTLRHTGSISHTIFLEPLLPTVTLTARVAGMDRYQTVRHGTPYRFTGLPEGYHSIVLVADSFYAELRLDSIAVSPHSEAVVGPDTLLDADI
jgi:hypothetical protein